MTSNRPYLVRALYEWICDNGLTPYLLVDAERPGLRVPPQAVNDGKVVLNLAPRAVQRLEMANDMISFQARFNGAAMLVLVPLYAVLAIYAMENGQGMMFPPEPDADDVGPDDVDGGASQGPDEPDPSPEPTDPPRRRGGLRVVK